jgi:hypothetical protein
LVEHAAMERRRPDEAAMASRAVFMRVQVL